MDLPLRHQKSIVGEYGSSTQLFEIAAQAVYEYESLVAENASSNLVARFGNLDVNLDSTWLHATAFLKTLAAQPRTKTHKGTMTANASQTWSLEKAPAPSARAPSTT